MGLLNSQCNELFALWQNEGLNPDDYLLITNDSDILTDPSARVEHKSTKYYFAFQTSAVNNSNGDIVVAFKIEHSPGNQRIKDNTYVPNNWRNLIINYIHWLHNIIKETKQPNLWEVYLKSKISIAPIDEDDNTKFSKIEIAQIKSNIMILRERLETLEHTKEQLDYANKKLDYLCERIEHLGKTDWKNISVNVLLIIYQMFATNPEMAKQIVIFYTELFPFLMHLPKLLGHN